jgi:hypothetical protein
MRVNADFPLCRNPHHEAVVRRVIEGCVDFLHARLGDRLRALVLTGSFSRGEGSVLAVDGRLRVLGDIEFFVVVPHQTDYRAVRREMQLWGKEAAEVLGGDEIAVDIEFGPVEMEYLRKRALPSIFVYDLITHGKVVWGPQDVLKEVPAFGPERIPREDAVHLIFNRTIEQLDAYDRIATLEGDALLDVAYQRLKLVLDLAGSALAFEGTHTSSYEARPAAFARLVAATPALAQLVPAAFQADLEQAAREKTAPSAAWFADAGSGSVVEQRVRLRRQIVASVPAVAALVRWELNGLLGGNASLTDALGRYLRAQPVRRRLWDWTRVALHPLPAPLPVSVLRSVRLFGRSTPRALLYTAGVLSYVNLIHDTNAPRAISDLLPLGRRAAPRTAAAQRRAITALWRWCVRNN